MHTPLTARPVLLGVTALTVLVTAGWASNTWPEVKNLGTLAAIVILAALCSIGAIAAVLIRLLGHESSEPPRQPQATAHAPHTRGTR